MDIKSIVSAGIVAVVVTVGGLWIAGPEQVVVSQPQTTYGALSGPDIISPYLQWGGVRTWNYSEPLAQATTTCSFLSPAGTSTLLFAGARFTTSYSATHAIEWGKGNTAFATTTSLGETRTIAASTQYVALASSTINSGTDATVVFAPNTYLNLKISSSTPTTPTGNCYATFVELP